HVYEYVYVYAYAHAPIRAPARTRTRTRKRKRPRLLHPRLAAAEVRIRPLRLGDREMRGRAVRLRPALVEARGERLLDAAPVVPHEPAQVAEPVRGQEQPVRALGEVQVDARLGRAGVRQVRQPERRAQRVQDAEPAAHVVRL